LPLLRFLTFLNFLKRFYIYDKRSIAVARPKKPKQNKLHVSNLKVRTFFHFFRLCMQRLKSCTVCWYDDKSVNQMYRFAKRLSESPVTSRHDGKPM